MNELLVLTQRYLRTALRTRSAGVLVVLYLVALHAAIWLPPAERLAGGTVMLGALMALVLFVFGVAAGAGNGLPADRRSGRVEWLQTLSPPLWKHKMACVLAGWVLAVAVGIGGGLAAAVTTAMWASGHTLRTAQTVDLAPKTLLRAPEADAERGERLVVELPRAADGATATLELDIRPRFLDPTTLTDHARIAWRADAGQETTVVASVRTPLRIDLPADTQVVSLSSLTPGVHLRLRAGRLLGPSASVPAALLLAGLLLGLMGGAAVPVAVLVSRATSGATASAAAFCLLLFGAAKDPLLAISSTMVVGDATKLALGFLETCARLTPDLGVVPILSEYGAGRALDGGALAWVPSLLLYTAAVAALASLSFARVGADRRHA